MDNAARGIVISYKVRLSDLVWMYLGSWAVRMLAAPGLFLLLVAATPPYVNVLADVEVGLASMVLAPIAAVVGLSVYNRTLPLIGTTVRLRIHEAGVQGWPAATGLDQTWPHVHRVRAFRGVTTIPFRQLGMPQGARRGWVPIPERALSTEQASFLKDLFERNGLAKSRR